jgi:hypothetical protein
MNARLSQRHHERDDYQQDEAACFARHARPVSEPEELHDAHFRQWRRERSRALDEDRSWQRQDRYKKFGESFDRWRASRPARRGAAGSHTLPPSIGTDPGQPYSAPPGASGKNK